ncbi:MAG: hybrid sensor histidine kinase/response regulator [Verrucomicrobiales bacterium]|nr:hybrid sensor histidine kinase/response regulator [Verrucomicrobiales bacterium]MCP5556495.1 hybrid sensor histidine kinase/response regulator [Verrucomicrobiaceae bacterium]
MQTDYDYRRYAVLYVDDEEMALKYFEKTFGKDFWVITADNAATGQRILEEQGDKIAVLLTDQRMPGEKGVELLQRARREFPSIIRMLITAYADFGVTVDAVNLGNIFRYVAKPLQVEDMRTTMQRAIEFYSVQRERDDLLSEKLSMLHNVIIADRVVSMGVLAAGLSNKVRNAYDAVERFLEMAPGRDRDECKLSALSDPSVWRQIYEQVLEQASRTGCLLGSLVADGPTDAPVQVGPMVEAVVASCKEAYAGIKIELSAEVDTDLPQIIGSEPLIRSMLEQILQAELAVLAYGSRVSVAANVAKTGAEVSGVRLTIEDDGDGALIRATRNVFDAVGTQTGNTAQPGAAVLVVYLIAAHHGGNVELCQEDGGKTKVTIELPLTPPAFDPDVAERSKQFISKVLVNDSLWDRLLAAL